jgi:hypothetical protein
MVDVAVPEGHLLPDSSPYTDGDRPDATVIDIVAGAAELPTPNAGRPAVVLTKTPGRWGDPRCTADIDAYWQHAQRDLATSLGATHVIALDAGHRLNEETPYLVALAVNAVVQAATRGGAVVLPPAVLRSAGGRLADVVGNS